MVGTNIRSLADLALLSPVGGSDRPDHEAFNLVNKIKTFKSFSHSGSDVFGWTLRLWGITKYRTGHTLGPCPKRCLGNIAVN